MEIQNIGAAMAFGTYTLGRSSSSDIQFNDPGISRVHVEITVTEDGRYYLVDANSSAGTYIWRHGDWVILKQGFISFDETISLGSIRVPVADIAARLKAAKPQPMQNWDPISIKPSRSSLTGEVIAGR